MKTAALPYHFHICISTAAGTVLTLHITTPSSAVYNNKPRLGQLSQGDVYAPAQWAGMRMDFFLSSSSAGLQASPPSYEGEGEQSPSQPCCPSGIGWQSRGARWCMCQSGLCTRGRLSLTHFMLCRSWLSPSQLSFQLGRELMACSPPSNLFTIIFQRDGWHFCNT